jgi:hypothetical protein
MRVSTGVAEERLVPLPTERKSQAYLSFVGKTTLIGYVSDS